MTYNSLNTEKPSNISSSVINLKLNGKVTNFTTIKAM